MHSPIRAHHRTRFGSLCLLAILLALSFGLNLAPGQAGPPAAAAAPIAGSVVAWGLDNWGQLGDGTSANDRIIATPQPVPGATGIIAVATGAVHGLALRSNGTLLAWGGDNLGQLGDGSVETTGCHCHPSPQMVLGAEHITAIAATGDTSLALKDDGTVLAWGNNQSGQLGNGTTTGWSALPQQVPGLTDIVAIAAGSAIYALKRDGTLLAWGSDVFGELGDGTPGGYTGTPQPVPGLTNIVAIAAGSGSAVALKNDGTLLAWGTDTLGQLGDGAAEGEPGCSGSCNATPQPVPGVTGITAISASGHVLARKNDGTVISWGYDGSGQLGDGSAETGVCFCDPTPKPVPGLTGIAGVAAGDGSMALKSDGTVLTWGTDERGLLGDGTPGGFVATPQLVPGLTNVVAIKVGWGSHNLAIVGQTETTTAANNANAIYGATSVALSASVSSDSAVNDGTVTFTVKGPSPAITLIGTATSGTVSGGNASASFTIPNGTAVGSYTIEANYSGASGFAESSDATPATLTIAKAETSAAIGTPTTLLSCGGSTVTIPVIVTNTSNTGALTGGTVTVSLTQGITALGSATVSIGTPPVASPATVNVTVAVSGVVVGNATVAASYSGDSNFKNATATTSTIVIPKATTTVAVSNATATYGDSNVTLSATVTSANGAPLTGGTVTFVVKKGTQILATLTSSPAVGASPAKVSVSLALGATYDARNYTIEATYNGNACFATGGGSGTLTVQRHIIWIQAKNRTVGLHADNPPTTPPTNCLASATATEACWLQLANGSTFAYGQSWSALNFSLLRFQYSRNPPSTNATEHIGSTYRITTLGVTATNYEIRYLPGMLTVQ